MSGLTDAGPALAAALSKFQAEVPVVAKGKTANVPMKGGGSYRYSYADLADVMRAGLPLLTRHGLSFSAAPRRTADGSYEVQGILLHESGEALTGELPVFGRTAQEIGSSITYNRRYLFGCLTGIVTDDDEDGSLAAAAEERTRPQAPPPPPPSPMDEARALVWNAWVAADGQNTTMGLLSAAYESDHGKPIQQATELELRQYAEELRARAADRDAMAEVGA